MLRKIFLNLAMLVVFTMLTSGCAVNRSTATLDPTADLVGIKSIYVKKFASDDRGVNLLIATKLKELGYLTTTAIDGPSDVDVIVTYRDKWCWDFTMYMLELTVTIRDPKTDFPLAFGKSFHTSFTRKSPEEMVDEVIDNIFKQVKQ